MTMQSVYLSVCAIILHLHRTLRRLSNRRDDVDLDVMDIRSFFKNPPKGQPCIALPAAPATAGERIRSTQYPHTTGSTKTATKPPRKSKAKASEDPAVVEPKRRASALPLKPPPPPEVTTRSKAGSTRSSGAIARNRARAASPEALEAFADASETAAADDSEATVANDEALDADVPTGPADTGLSEYEKQRLANIKKNQVFCAAWSKHVMCFRIPAAPA